jgi:hypothetical protein
VSSERRWWLSGSQELLFAGAESFDAPPNAYARAVFLEGRHYGPAWAELGTRGVENERSMVRIQHESAVPVTVEARGAELDLGYAFDRRSVANYDGWIVSHFQHRTVCYLNMAWAKSNRNEANHTANMCLPGNSRRNASAMRIKPTAHCWCITQASPYFFFA